MPDEFPLEGEEHEMPNDHGDGNADLDLPEKAEESGSRIEIVKDGNCYYWGYHAANGVLVATGPTPHKQLSHLKAAIEGIRRDFATAPLIKRY